MPTAQAGGPGSQYYGPMTSIFDKDRARGQALPAGVNLTRIARIQAERSLPRVPDRLAALRSGFELVDGRRDLLKRAHALWAIKKAEDGDGYVLLRLRDEPSPTVLEKMAKHAQVNYGLRYSAAALYRKAQLEDAVPGNIAAVARDFEPMLHGGQVELREGDLYKVTGFFAPTEENDQIQGVPKPIYPPDDKDRARYLRVRLRPAEGGNFEVYVLPDELDVHFDVRGAEPERKPDFYERSVQRRQDQSTRNERLPPPPSEGVGPDQGLSGLEDTVDIRQ